MWLSLRVNLIFPPLSLLSSLLSFLPLFSLLLPSLFKNSLRCLHKTPAPDIDSCVYILLDATWQQAKKMLRKAPSLQACQRLSLSSLKQSRYSLRKNQQPGSFSSVESGVSLLRELGLEDDAVAIEAYFDRFLLHSEANRSGYALDENS